MADILRCERCGSLETNYGFEFYISTQNNPCKIIYCVFCKFSEKQCHICKNDLKSHCLKTKFALMYEKSLQEEDLNFQKLINIRLDIEKKWSRLKNELSDQLIYSNYLELIEDAIQAKSYDDNTKFAYINRQLEDLDEKNRINKLQDINQEIQINRPPPKQIFKTPSNGTKQTKDHNFNQSYEIEYYKKKFMRSIPINN